MLQKLLLHHLHVSYSYRPNICYTFPRCWSYIWHCMLERSHLKKKLQKKEFFKGRVQTGPWGQISLWPPLLPCSILEIMHTLRVCIIKYIKTGNTSSSGHRKLRTARHWFVSVIHFRVVYNCVNFLKHFEGRDLWFLVFHCVEKRISKGILE